MNKRGFTLIEVIAVISILSLVFIVAIPKVNDYIKTRKNDSFITNVRNIARQLEYDNLEYKTFEKTTLLDLNITGISQDDFDLSSSVAYVIEDEIYIDIVGKGKYKDMYVCHVNTKQKDISIQKEPCNTNIGDFIYVNFDVELNGGTTNQKFEEKYISGKYLELEIPIKDKNIFKGWYIEKGNSVIVGDRIKIGTEDTVVRALWTAKIMLTIDLDEGSISIDQSKTYESETIVELRVPTKEGYTFTGWELVSGNSVLSGNTLTIGTEDTVIRATYKLNASNLIIDLDGGSVSTKQDGDYELNYILNLTAPTKPGYTFAGWQRISGNSILSGNSITIGTEDTIIKALWEKNKYIVALNANEGIMDEIDIEVTYMEQYGELPIPIREGYTFIGWYTELDGVNRVDSKTVVTETENHELYAGWLYSDFAYINDEVEFVVPLSGYYQLEVWGAQGGRGMQNGTSIYEGGYGGYSKGIVYLEEGETIYINVGGKGEDAADIQTGGVGGYNGGGTGGTDTNYSSTEGNEPGAGGGGATHIATTSGLISTFTTETQDQIYIVAGGGGGSAYSGSGGAGGGIIGGTGNSSTTVPGSQTTGNLIGQGGAGTSSKGGGGGGGSGFYGGQGGTADTGGAGGSGYIGNPLLTNKSMYCYDCIESTGYSNKTLSTTNVSETATSNYAKIGDGFAKVFYIGNDVELETFGVNSKEEFYLEKHEQKYIVPISGYYQLEVWGAQGGKGVQDGTPIYEGGYGGYSKGITYLEEGETIYINVGGKGEDAADIQAGGTGGYNGGAAGGTDTNYSSSGGNEPGAGGGGATHMAKTSGLLSTFTDETLDQIYIVAGGGGGSAYYGAGGAGGGMIGRTGSSSTTVPGSQTTGNLIGQGGAGTSSKGGGGGGGSGFYGGKGGAADTSGAGGSGYIGNPLLTNKVMYCYECDESPEESTKTISTTNVSETPVSNYAKIGNGHAIITYKGNN